MKMAKKVLSFILALHLAVMSLFIGQVSAAEMDIFRVFPAYTLTPAYVAGVEKQLGLCKRMLMNHADAAVFEAAVNYLDVLVSEVQNQSAVAEVLYYYDMEDENRETDYLYATEASSRLSNRYIRFLQEVYDSGIPEYESFFAGWSESQLRYLCSGAEEAAALEARNAEIMTQTFALSGEEFETQIGPLYSEFVDNSNRLAELSGYDNYYEYATELVYMRDYDADGRQTFRQYVADYIIPVSEVFYDRYQDSYSSLDREGKSLLRNLLFSDYLSLEEDYLDAYFDSLNTGVKEGMQHMFVNENYVTTNSENSYEGAFTLSVYEEPFCYFGPGYQDVFTVVHEIGHYYAELCTGADWVSYDLCETHSQGNEMLYLKYLEEELPEEVYDTLVYYQLYYFTELIVQATLVDAFEEQVYALPDVTNYTTGDFDALVSEVLREFGLDETDEYMQESVEWLWRNIGISSPVYYLSYATSAMASINIYSKSVEDYDAAVEAYRKIQEEVNEEDTFMATLENAGLSSVFEEEAYENLLHLFNEE